MVNVGKYSNPMEHMGNEVRERWDLNGKIGRSPCETFHPGGRIKEKLATQTS